MTLQRRLLRLYHYPANIVSWALFAAVGLSLNFVSALLLLSRDRARHGPAVRAAMRRLFSAWCAWLHATRLIYVRFHGFTPDALSGLPPGGEIVWRIEAIGPGGRRTASEAFVSRVQ